MKSNEFKFYTKFDEIGRRSTLFLTKNDIIIDSIKNIGSYYGKDSIVKRNNNHWEYFYNGRCGTGCSVVYYMNLSPIDDKIKVKLNILYKYKEVHYGNQMIKEYSPHFSSSRNYITKVIVENGIQKQKIENEIKYDKKNHIYYNEVFEFNRLNYKGIKIDSLKYILFKENEWKFYDSDIKKINDLK
ncbi:hypothetical protein [Chryseobacterium daecheongense]|uniref:hypothetical protein n=1 Tax=Chryseobacterium daecheongense TaxID=192389 RepID=UPI001064DA8B|nr:hypothetical protein [Chryseobacterium daecheongense]